MTKYKKPTKEEVIKNKTIKIDDRYQKIIDNYYTNEYLNSIIIR